MDYRNFNDDGSINYLFTMALRHTNTIMDALLVIVISKQSSLWFYSTPPEMPVRRLIETLSAI